jgi:hypothetical protein
MPACRLLGRQAQAGADSKYCLVRVRLLGQRYHILFVGMQQTINLWIAPFSGVFTFWSQATTIFWKMQI